MKILIVPDSYKGSLSAQQVCKILADSLSEIPNIQTEALPFSDGGEGFGSSCCSVCKGEVIYSTFHDLYHNQIQAPIYCCGNTAVIECAATCALQNRRAVMQASSYGTGEQIRFAFRQGFRSFIIGLGGSGMCDGGSGALAALGIDFFDQHNNRIPYPTGGDLLRFNKLEISKAANEIVKYCDFTYACDVTNSFFGTNGAAYVFAGQKGADSHQIQLLDRGLQHLNTLLPHNVQQLEGSGAAGGLCGGLYSLFGGKIKSGFDILADLAQLEEKIKAADLVVTGEGKTDRQTLMGKLPYRVAKLAGKHQKRCVVISGDSDGTVIGDKVITLTDVNTPPQEAINRCASLLYAKAKYILQ